MTSRPEKTCTIKAVIVDDETPARKRIRELLCQRDEFEIVGECSNGEDAIEAIVAKSPDVVFLDIQLQDMNGFDVLGRLPSKRLPLIVFVTAYDEYALKAFDVHALDYLLKPFDDERFEAALDVAYEQITRNQIETLNKKLTDLLGDYRNNKEVANPKESAFQTRLVIRSAGKVDFIETTDIDWISADGYYASIHSGGRSHLIRTPLKSLEKVLDPEVFIRIHRSTIININRIAELRSHFHGEYFVTLKDGKRFKLSRGYRKNAEKLLGGSSKS